MSIQSFKYSVLSFIIGKDYEILREIAQPQDDIEYLMVTDYPDLKSSTWKVIYDPDLLKLKSGFERCFAVRYNAFKYCSADICVTIDGSIEVIGSLDKLVNEFNAQQYDICLMPHPIWHDFLTEYSMWVKSRHYPIENAHRFFEAMQCAKYDMAYKGLFQLGFSMKRRSCITDAIDSMTMSMLKYLSIGQDKFERLDQTVFTFVMNRYFNHLKVLPVSEQVIRSYALQLYWHNSMNKNMNIFYNINKPDVKWMFNKEVECMYLKQ